ncbi:MFS transporter [Conexibacter sp. SYSU D00693]|uniref:MFS transporter n=1 Tax=Conexibacter sp. SYSU D00693 TaxID=2812560 RepID=UPI00196A2ECF|nr:MFS transporter [Conexibacter sp. SYSU D00693]
MAGAASPLERLRTAGRERPRQAAFAGVFLAALLCFLAVGAVLPILPRYVTGPIGAGDVAVGVVVGAFAFSAVAGRPVGGRMADRRSRRWVVVVGLLVCVLAGLLYLVPAGVAGLVVARLVLGIGDGWVFTAGLSWIVDLAPEERRGQAIGIFGLAIWGGLAAGPLIGEAAHDLGSYELVFACSAVLPALGALVALRVPDAHVGRVVTGGARSLLPPGVLGPGMALGLANVGYGTMAGFVVLLLADNGVERGAAVFTAFATAVVLARLVLGRLPDVLGARVTAAGAGVAEAAGLALLAVAGTLPVALAGAIVMGLGFSLLFPSLALIAVERVGEERRATALGAFTAFFDVGVGLGAPIAGAISAAASYEAAFLVAAGAAAAGVLVGLVAAAQPRATPA